MDTSLLGRVDQWLGVHRDEIIADLIGLVKIPSVSIADSQFPPFGKACQDALRYMSALGTRHGYKTHNFDSYVGSIEFSQSETSIGIWAHLDVVPVPDPSTWDYPPFEGTLVENRYLIGRGAQDNKAAAIGVFHVFNCLHDLGIKLRHGYCLYCGTSEETGMEDIRYFKANYPCPDLSIVPDTGFPVCYGQRGSMCLRLHIPMHIPITIEQSNNVSVTPDKITASLPNGRILCANGISTHVYHADAAKSAVVDLLHQLAQSCKDDAKYLERLAAICSDWDGKSLGLAYSDDLSGCLRIAATNMGCQDEKLYVDLYSILPVTSNADALIDAARRTANAQGISLECIKLRPPCSFPIAHPIVSLLTDVYNNVACKNSKPFIMSGGNYAACLPNAFGFGPGMPDREYPSHIFKAGHGDYHQYDESEDIEQMLDFMRVYVMSIIAVDQTDNLKAQG